MNNAPHTTTEELTAEEKAIIDSFRALDEDERRDVLGVQKHFETAYKGGIVSDVGAYYSLIESGKIPKENDIAPAEIIELAEAIHTETADNEDKIAQTMGLLAAAGYAAGYVRGATAQHQAENHTDTDDADEAAILHAYRTHPEGIRRAVRLVLELENPTPDEIAQVNRANMRVIKGTKEGGTE